jgi:hypothetical protein
MTALDATDDCIVILHSVHKKHAAKQFTRIVDRKTGEVKIKNRSYANENRFRVECIRLGSVDDFAATLDRLIGEPFAFVIRGAPLPCINLDNSPRWKRPHGGQPATFGETSHFWFFLDLDHILAPPLCDVVNDPEAAIEHLIGLLPAALQDAHCWWEFTASQGLPKTDSNAADTLSARLGFWSDTRLTDAELKRWATAVNRAAGYKLVDPSLFDAIQAHYLAAPRFFGMADPLPRRHGIRLGLEDTVSLVIPPPADVKHPTEPGEGYAPGRGVAAYLAMIGKPDFREPIKKAIASCIGTYGAAVDCTKLKKEIRQAIDAADPDGRDQETLDRYKSDDHLDSIIDAIRAFQGDRPGRGLMPGAPPEFDVIPPLSEPEKERPDRRPIVRLVEGDLPMVIDRCEQLLLTINNDIFAFGDQIVRPARRPIRIADEQKVIGLRVVSVAPGYMVDCFTRNIKFERYNKNKGDWVPADCPRNLASIYLERMGLWKLRQLSALTTCPLLLADGRIIDQPGFDATTGIYFDPQGIKFPPVPEIPTKNEARAALTMLISPFREFPFVNEEARSVLRSLLLSSVSRHAYRFVPLHAFDATAIGTGKSKLLDCGSIMLTGHECAVVSQPKDEVEFEKKLFALLLAGDPLVSIDNCDDPLNSPFLCMTLTQPLVQSRILGLSKTASIPNSVLMCANGNNFSLTRDMQRRAIIGKLDAGVEKPWERTFTTEDPVVVFKRERAQLVVAALTVLRAYIVAGQPKQSAPPLGGFEQWGRLVRDCILWLGEADPCLTIEATRAIDPKRLELIAVVTQWREVLGPRSLTARTAAEEACAMMLERGTGPNSTDRYVFVHPAFCNALLEVAAGRPGERGLVHGISINRLGAWLRANKGTIVSVFGGQGTYQCRLVDDGVSAGYGRWRLQEQHQDGATWTR